MTLNFTNIKNDKFTLSTNSNELKFTYKNKELCNLQSNSNNDISNLIIEFENIDYNIKDEMKDILYGQIKYINLEGGFYGIITESNEKYLPINLQVKLKDYVNDYISITASYSKKGHSEIDVYMWGKMLYVESYGIIVID